PYCSCSVHQAEATSTSCLSGMEGVSWSHIGMLPPPTRVNGDLITETTWHIGLHTFLPAEGSEEAEHWILLLVGAQEHIGVPESHAVHKSPTAHSVPEEGYAQRQLH
ncbi:hypothetical protein H1C71_022456, partial [Ictidomys tridecemlineatus]